MSDVHYERVTFPSIDRAGTAGAPRAGAGGPGADRVESDDVRSTVPTASDRYRAATRAEVRGHAAGYAAGLRQAGAEVQAMGERLAADHAARVAEHDALVTARLVALDAAVAALGARVAPVLAEAERTMVEAAMELAEAVVGYELAPATASAPSSADTGLEAPLASGARAAVARALASVDPATVVTLRLSPEDAAALGDAELPVPVSVDPALAHGDAVAVLPDGLVDARIAGALDRARRALGFGA